MKLYYLLKLPTCQRATVSTTHHCRQLSCQDAQLQPLAVC